MMKIVLDLEKQVVFLFFYFVRKTTGFIMTVHPCLLNRGEEEKNQNNNNSVIIL